MRHRMSTLASECFPLKISLGMEVPVNLPPAK